MPMQHTRVAECALNVGYICHPGTAFLRVDFAGTLVPVPKSIKCYWDVVVVVDLALRRFTEVVPNWDVNLFSFL